MKKITVIVRNLPLNTRRNAEALRMSVGLTLRDDKITVIFIDDGVYSATRLKPEVIKFPILKQEFAALKILKCGMLADRPSLERRGIENLHENITVAERDEIVKTITEADIVVTF